MIDVSELHSLIKHEQQPLTDIEQIFRALVGYPGEEEIRNATRADLIGALDAACEALLGDSAIAPRGTADFVADELSDEPPQDHTYGALAAAIQQNPDHFRARLVA